MGGETLSGDDCYMHDRRSASGGVLVSLISLAVGLGSLALSVIIVFNGSGRQAQFESNRQLCVEGLVEYAQTLMVLQSTTGAPDPDLGANLVGDRALAEIVCFDSGVLDSGGAFYDGWLAYARVAYENVQLRGLAYGNTQLNESVPRIARASFAQMNDAINIASGAAVDVTGPGFWPWEDGGVATLPDFPPFPDSTPPEE